MSKRVTGALVNKGDLVTSKQTYFSFDTQFPWIAGELSNETDYQRFQAPVGVGIVIDALPKYDRGMDGNDCSVFWISTQKISKESSQCLKIISKSHIVNR